MATRVTIVAGVRAASAGVGGFFLAMVVVAIALFAVGPLAAAASAEPSGATASVPTPPRVGTASATPRAKVSTAYACQTGFPTATDGHLVLGSRYVRPGGFVLGVLSGFTQWPQALIGGASGETFLDCSPWPSSDLAEVIVHDSAGYFLLPVPPSAVPGTYIVGVRFHQGSTGPFDDLTPTVELTASVIVTGNPAAPGAASPACQVPHAAASAGTLGVPAVVHPGDSMPVTLAGTTTGLLNEYDRLCFVACFDGQPTVVTYPGPASTRTSSAFTVPIPSGIAPGAYQLAVTGVGTSGNTPPSEPTRVVTWRHAVTVQVKQATSTPRPSALVTPAQTATPQPSSSATPNQSPTPGLAATGSHINPWRAAALGTTLALLGLAIVATGTAHNFRAVSPRAFSATGLSVDWCGCFPTSVHKPQAVAGAARSTRRAATREHKV